mmetsp:Transcript_80906/g.143293  ORF Transcript_80906/g.143293 Transcript_80906/m.143293 type:complete len:284 (+) Transcript_80906:3484-4335(+)
MVSDEGRTPQSNTVSGAIPSHNGKSTSVVLGAVGLEVTVIELDIAGCHYGSSIHSGSVGYEPHLIDLQRTILACVVAAYGCTFSVGRIIVKGAIRVLRLCLCIDVCHGTIHDIVLKYHLLEASFRLSVMVRRSTIESFSILEGAIFVKWMCRRSIIQSRTIGTVAVGEQDIVKLSAYIVLGEHATTPSKPSATQELGVQNFGMIIAPSCNTATMVGHHINHFDIINHCMRILQIDCSSTPLCVFNACNCAIHVADVDVAQRSMRFREVKTSPVLVVCVVKCGA